MNRGQQIRYVESSIDSIDFSSDRPTVHLSNGDKLRARLIVAADGFNSIVRREAGIEQIVRDYNQKAIVGTVATSISGSNSTAWQRFLSTGPIALLPVGITSNRPLRMLLFD